MDPEDDDGMIPYACKYKRPLLKVSYDFECLGSIV